VSDYYNSGRIFHHTFSKIHHVINYAFLVQAFYQVLMLPRSLFI